MIFHVYFLKQNAYYNILIYLSIVKKNNQKYLLRCYYLLVVVGFENTCVARIHFRKKSIPLYYVYIDIGIQCVNKLF